MEQFNLNEYLADTSRKVVTRDGKPVRILCTDARRGDPIVALVSDKSIDYLFTYHKDGTETKDTGGSRDLFFDVEKKSGWVNVYKYKIADTDQLEASCIFSTKEEAEFCRGDNQNYVATTKIEWEE